MFMLIRIKHAPLVPLLIGVLKRGVAEPQELRKPGVSAAHPVLDCSDGAVANVCGFLKNIQTR